MKPALSFLGYRYLPCASNVYSQPPSWRWKMPRYLPNCVVPISLSLSRIKVAAPNTPGGCVGMVRMYKGSLTMLRWASTVWVPVVVWLDISGLDLLSLVPYSMLEYLKTRSSPLFIPRRPGDTYDMQIDPGSVRSVHRDKCSVPVRTGPCCKC